MKVTRITTDLAVDDIGAARSFYTDYLGLSLEEFNLGWVARFTDPNTGEHVQLLTRDETAPVMPVASLHVDDIEAFYEQAAALGLQIVHPLTTEAWGVRRFFVQAPDGSVFNIVAHSPDEPDYSRDRVPDGETS